MKYAFITLLLLTTNVPALASTSEQIQDSHKRIEYYGSPLLPDAIAFRIFLDYFDNYHNKGVSYGENIIAQQFTPWLEERRSKQLAKVLVKVSAKIKQRDIRKKRKILCPEWRSQRHEEDIFLAMDNLDSARQRVASRGLNRFIQKLDEDEQAQFIAFLADFKKGIDYVEVDSKYSYQQDTDMNVRDTVEEICSSLDGKEAE